MKCVKNHSEAFRNVKFNPGEKMSVYAVFTTVSRAVRQVSRVPTQRGVVYYF